MHANNWLWVEALAALKGAPGLRRLVVESDGELGMERLWEAGVNLDGLELAMDESGWT